MEKKKYRPVFRVLTAEMIKNLQLGLTHSKDLQEIPTIEDIFISGLKHLMQGTSLVTNNNYWKYVKSRSRAWNFHSGEKLLSKYF